MAPKKNRKRRSGGGLGRVAAAAARQKGKAQWLKLDDGDVYVVRVLDVGEEFKDAFVHRVPMEREDGSNYYADVPCLDQDDKGTPCPGCKDDIDRRYKFWCNVIVREFEDESGAEKDTLMIWSGGITIAKRLDKLDGRFGLGNRDLEVEREGSTMKNTKYEIEPATDSNEELSDEDRAFLEKRHDLKRYTTPPEFDDFYVPLSERNKDDDDDDSGAKSVKRGSAFKRRKKEDEDDEDEKPRTASRRRKPAATEKSGGASLKGFGSKSKSASKGSAEKTTVRRRRSR